jgi:hypothetical protein
MSFSLKPVRIGMDWFGRPPDGAADRMQVPEEASVSLPTEAGINQATSDGMAIIRVVKIGSMTDNTTTFGRIRCTIGTAQVLRSFCDAGNARITDERTNDTLQATVSTGSVLLAATTALSIPDCTETQESAALDKGCADFSDVRSPQTVVPTSPATHVSKGDGGEENSHTAVGSCFAGGCDVNNSDAQRNHRNAATDAEQRPSPNRDQEQQDQQGARLSTKALDVLIVPTVMSEAASSAVLAELDAQQGVEVRTRHRSADLLCTTLWLM